MSKLTECPCCGYPHDDVEARAMANILNKIKADAVRDYVSDCMEAHWILHLSENNLLDRVLISLNEYAGKLERGDI